MIYLSMVYCLCQNVNFIFLCVSFQYILICCLTLSIASVLWTACPCSYCKMISLGWQMSAQCWIHWLTCCGTSWQPCISLITAIQFHAMHGRIFPYYIQCGIFASYSSADIPSAPSCGPWDRFLSKLSKAITVNIIMKRKNNVLLYCTVCPRSFYSFYIVILTL